jgi:hypothetical protein
MKMKKTILLSLVIVTIISCNFSKKTPIEQLQADSETMLKANLHDPSSYEFVSFEGDTLMGGLLEQREKDILAEIKNYKKDSIKNKEEIETQMDNLQATEYLKSKAKNKMEFLLRYRAKNKMGSLSLGTLKVTTDSIFNITNIE